MRSFSRQALTPRYEPSPVWEDTARAYKSMFIEGPDEWEDDPALEGFFPGDDGFVGIRWRLRLEDAARVAATSSLLGESTNALVERAIATQWYLDKNMSTGLEMVLHGERRFRRSVALPLTPRRLFR